MALSRASDTQLQTVALGRKHSPSQDASGAFCQANPPLQVKPTPLHLLPQGRAAYSHKLEDIGLQEGLIGGEHLV